MLVTGGAGYIGSHAVRHLLAAGHRVVVVDNLSRGHREAIDPAAAFIEADVRETRRLIDALDKHRVDCLLHFAALAYVGESVQEPLSYYENNTGGTLSVLRALEAARTPRLVFSSTCATYGEPDEMPITETSPQNPINPYGASKLFSERMIADFAARYPEVRCAALRYFNVAGSAQDGSLGEHHDPETHLIPIIFQAALGRRDQVTIFGDDYDTPDGTCIRDYIHVEDLVEAHELVMRRLEPGFVAYNLGIGRGYSVREIIDAAREVVGRPFRVAIGARRPGDPPQLYADPSQIERVLGWRARRTDIGATIRDAWGWFRAHPNGYGGG